MVAEEKDTLKILPFIAARKRFDDILCRVEAGETVLLTRDGQVVAQISPPSEDQRELTEPHIEAQRFLEKVAELRNGEPTGVTREEILAWRHEGHRW